MCPMIDIGEVALETLQLLQYGATLTHDDSVCSNTPEGTAGAGPIP